MPGRTGKRSLQKSIKRFQQESKIFAEKKLDKSAFEWYDN